MGGQLHDLLVQQLPVPCDLARAAAGAIKLDRILKGLSSKFDRQDSEV